MDIATQRAHKHSPDFSKEMNMFIDTLSCPQIGLLGTSSDYFQLRRVNLSSIYKHFAHYFIVVAKTC